MPQPTASKNNHRCSPGTGSFKDLQEPSNPSIVVVDYSPVMWGTTNIVNIVTTVRCCGCQQLEPADWLALSMSNFHYTKPKAAIYDVPWSLAIQQNDIWSGSFSMLKDVGIWRRCYLKVNLKAKGGWMSTRIRKLTTGRHSWGAPAGTCRFWHSHRGCQHSSSSCWRTADEPVDGSMSLTLVGVEHVSFRILQMSPAVTSCHWHSLADWH